MSVQGFNFDGTVHKYEYGSLQNIPQNLAQPYSTSATYAVGDCCTYNNVLYKCTTAISTAESWTSGHWSAVKLTDDVGDLKSALSENEVLLKLLVDDVPNTIQAYAFSDGSVSQVVHSRSGSAVRTDSFTYGDGTITETRTLATGESLTIETDLETLETVITYAVA